MQEVFHFVKLYQIDIDLSNSKGLSVVLEIRFIPDIVKDTLRVLVSIVIEIEQSVKMQYVQGCKN